jgi:hypothetical protein
VREAVKVGTIVEKVMVMVAVKFGVQVFDGNEGPGPGPDGPLVPQDIAISVARISADGIISFFISPPDSVIYQLYSIIGALFN